MEDTRREADTSQLCTSTKVLILVLMEDTLRGNSKRPLQKVRKVLILVVMEDTRRDKIIKFNLGVNKS